MDHDIDDVAFTIAVLDDLAGRTAIVGCRVQATGHSSYRGAWARQVWGAKESIGS